MKKPLLSFRMAQSWNKLLRKFFKLFRRFEILRFSGDATSIELNQMQRKLQSIFNRLSKLQSRVGIKIAGSAIALMLMSTQLNAQSYHNDGPLTYNHLTPFSMGIISCVSTGDIDGDGDLDIVAGEYLGTTAILQNNGNGEFTYESSILVDTMPLSVGYLPAPTLADVDEDGDLDLYVGLYTGSIKVALNDGNGVFTSAPDMMADDSLLDVGLFAFPEFADVDEDGDLDLYVGELDSVVKVFINNNGTFTSAGNMQAGGTNISVQRFPQPAFYDFDADNDLDLYLGTELGVIHYYTNDGSGVFNASPNLQADATTIDIGSYSSPAFIDVNDDGFMDVISGNIDGGIKVFLNNGSGVLSEEGDLVVEGGPFNFGSFSAPSFADIDMDGDLDVFVGLYEGEIAFLNNDGAGNLTSGANLMAANVELDAGMLVIPVFADIDEDNDMDIFVGNNAGNIVFFMNNGAGVFAAGDSAQAGGVDIDAGSNAAPEFADVDEDGDLDLFVGNSVGNILVFENDGSGIFTAALNSLFQADGDTLDVGDAAVPFFYDIDQDGDIDLLVGEYYGSVKVYMNDGTGAFTSSPTNVQVDGMDIDNGNYAIPRFANIDGGCGPDLLIGGYQTPIYHYSYTDTIAPTITCPADFTYNLLQFQNNYTVSGTSLDPISASDNCNIESVLNDFNGNATLAGVDFPAGTETITWTVTDVDGNTQTCSVDVTVNVFNALDDLSAMGISMYPNPSTGFFNIENAQNFNILISDAFGKTMGNYANVQDAKFEVDLTNSPAGIYFITVSNETEVRTAKMVIE